MRKTDRVLNERIRELCGVTKGVDKKWFVHVERMEKDRITKRVYVRECAGCCSVGRPRKRWINNEKECIKKRGLDVTRW